MNEIIALKSFRSFYDNFTKNNNPVVIVCTSYPSVMIVISLLEELQKDGIKVELIVANDDLFQLFETNFKGSYNRILNFNKETPHFKSAYDILGIIKEKKYLLRLKKQIHYTSNANILFFTWYYVDRNFYLIRYLKKRNNKLFSIKIGELGPGLLANSIKERVITTFYRLVYGKEISLLKAYETTFTAIKNSYLSDVKIYNIDHNDIKKVFNTNKKWKIDEDIKIIYFDAPFDGKNEKAISELKDYLLNKLNNYAFSIRNIGIKYHPGRKKNKHLLRYGVEIPQYFPSELLDFKNCILAIGFASYTLSKSNINDIPGICLEYLTQRDKNSRGNIVDHMESLNDNLFYPKSLNELDRFLDNILINE